MIEIICFTFDWDIFISYLVFRIRRFWLCTIHKRAKFIAIFWYLMPFNGILVICLFLDIANILFFCFQLTLEIIASIRQVSTLKLFSDRNTVFGYFANSSLLAGYIAEINLDGLGYSGLSLRRRSTVELSLALHRSSGDHFAMSGNLSVYVYSWDGGGPQWGSARRSTLEQAYQKLAQPFL